MSNKKIGKHLQFYMNYISDEIIPTQGLCGSCRDGAIDGELLLLFKPDYVSIFDFWASGKKHHDCKYTFTELRQTIVLFMAAINDEL